MNHPDHEAGHPAGDPLVANLLEGLGSSEAERRHSTLGIIITLMWSDDPQTKADATRAVVSALYSVDRHMVQKASSGLGELPIGLRYMEMALANPELSGFARATVQTRVALLLRNPPRRCDLSADDLAESLPQYRASALEEAKYHQFSSVFSGILAYGEPRIRYSFDVSLVRPPELHGLVSFSPLDAEAECRDDDCLPVVKGLVGEASYSERPDLAESSTVPGIRYFAGGAPQGS